MAKRKVVTTNKNVIGSVAGIEAEKKEPDTPEDINSEPDNTKVGERDSGVAEDPTTTGPVEEDGNLDPVNDQSNETAASDNPTNKEVLEGATPNEPDDDELLGIGGDTDPDLDDGSDAPLTDEEIAAAAAELEAEAAALAKGEPEIAAQDPNVDPTDLPPPDGEVGPGGLSVAHNPDGYRNMFVNRRGGITVMDDKTAERFYHDPKFYSYTYDAVEHKNTHVDFLEWCDEKGNRSGQKVGDKYERDE